MDVELILAVGGMIATVLGTIVALLAYRDQVSPRRQRSGAPVITEYQDTEIPGITDYSVFAPDARILGLSSSFVDRDAERKRVLRALRARQHKSILVVRGMPGVGKSSFAAAVCSIVSKAWRRRYAIAWVFCSERNLTLETLLRSIVWEPELPQSVELRRLALMEVEDAEIIDEFIRYLTKVRVLLVLDDYHLVTDKGVQSLVMAIASSRTRSTALLTSRMRTAFSEQTIHTLQVDLGGLGLPAAREFLKNRGADLNDAALRKVWTLSGDGVPQAMCVFLGLTRTESLYTLLDNLPLYTRDAEHWIKRLLEPLSRTDRRIVDLLAFVREPARRDLLEDVFSSGPLAAGLARLQDRFVVSVAANAVALHPLIRDYVAGKLSGTRRHELAQAVTEHYQRRARSLITGQDEEPSYGLLYLESFPEYVSAATMHRTHIDQLLALARRLDVPVDEGAEILVLGAGHGTHDAAFVEHGFRVTNVEILPEVAEHGRRAAREYSAAVRYVVADMTKPLELPAATYDAVFNIGSSFGYESEDDSNEMIFRNAYSLLKPGGPLLFSYANGMYWSTEVSRDVRVRELPNGSIRTTYKIYNPYARVSLDIITLTRTDGTGGHFYHFIHYYSADEVKAMLNREGFEVLGHFGDHEGGPFDPETSPGMVLLARKPIQP